MTSADLSPRAPTRSQRRLRERYGPWAVVTGASDGIGRQTALRLAEAGLHVALVARRGSLLEEVAGELENAHRVRTMVLPVDLADPAGVAEVVAKTQDREVGLLVAAAGFGGGGRFIDGDLAHELAMVDVNCRAVMALSHHFGKRFAAQGRGGLVLMSSLLAFQGVPRAAHYAATKAYIQSFAEALHHELLPFGVDVVASAPGPIHSGFAQRAGMKMGLALPASAVAQTTLDALGRRITVRPGWLSKALEASLMFLPRWARVRILALVMGGMTSHQP